MSTTRRTLLKTGLAGGAGLAAAPLSPLLWTQASAATATAIHGIHLAYGARPAHQMGVSWSTPHSVRRPVLDLGTTRDYGMTVGADSVSSLRVGSVYHHVDLSGLRPNTTYHYRLRHAGGTARIGTFTTAPARPRRFRFAAFGDMGVNGAAATNVALIRSQRPDLAFVVGDLCYADAGGEGVTPATSQDFTLWDSWLTQIQPIAKHVPWMTTVGNHEMENGNGELGYDGYLARFRLPRNGAHGAPVTYSFTHGNVGFVVLDGNDASYEIDHNAGYATSAIDAWLVSRLHALRNDDDIDFIVVGFHNCAYCTNKAHASDGGIRDRWEAIFDRFSVDLVVNGHNHCYERTHLMRGGVAVQEAPAGASVETTKGTIYLTAGGGGASSYPEVANELTYYTGQGGVKVPEVASWNAVGTADHAIAFLDVTPRNKHGVATMRLRTLTADRTVVDTLTMRRTTKA